MWNSEVLSEMMFCGPNTEIPPTDWLRNGRLKKARLFWTTSLPSAIRNPPPTVDEAQKLTSSGAALYTALLFRIQLWPLDPAAGESFSTPNENPKPFPTDPFPLNRLPTVVLRKPAPTLATAVLFVNALLSDPAMRWNPSTWLSVTRLLYSPFTSPSTRTPSRPLLTT